MTLSKPVQALRASAAALHGRPSATFDARRAHTLALLHQAAQEHPGTVVQTTSLGAEDMVITDLIARHWLPIAVATLDTGHLHVATLSLLPRIQARYDLVVERWQPQAAQVLRFVSEHGDLAMRHSVALRKSCCELRKLEPLARLLQGRTAWVTGLRREQAQSRAALPFVEAEETLPRRIKFNPLADWTWAEVWHYIATFEVPYNPLHDEFFPSIGCAPCTRAVALGEDPRAGRWWWEEQTVKECGLHVKSEIASVRITPVHLSQPAHQP